MRPVRIVSQAARQMSAATLHERLALNGPQDEVKELADAFDNMLDRLEAAFEQQSQFTANAAHELRTPLTSMRATLEVMQANAATCPTQNDEMVSTLERAVGRLERLVADLLLLSKGEKDIERDPLVLGVLLEEALLELAPMAAEKHVTLSLQGETELMVDGDAVLLERVFANIVENGVRYNRVGGSMDVSVRHEGSVAYIAFQDIGIGIPEQELCHIFDRFYRVDPSRARHLGGAGLGLSITAHVVRLHNGEIHVQSVPGQGSTFPVGLPLGTVRNSPRRWRPPLFMWL